MTIQSSLDSIRFFDTFCISNLKFALFGLTNSFVALFMAMVEQITFCVTWSAVPVNAKTGVPKGETNRRVFYLLILPLNIKAILHDYDLR